MAKYLANGRLPIGIFLVSSNIHDTLIHYDDVIKWKHFRVTRPL